MSVTIPKEELLDIPHPFDARINQSPELKKQTDEVLEVQEALVEAQIEASNSKVEAQTEALHSQEWLEWDVTVTPEVKSEAEQLENQVKNKEEMDNQGFFEKIGNSPIDRTNKVFKTNLWDSAKLVTGIAISAGAVWAGIRWLKKMRNRAWGETTEKKEAIVVDTKWWIWWLVKKVTLWGWAALAATYLASYFLKWKNLKDLWTDFLAWLNAEKNPGESSTTDAGSSNAIDNSENELEEENPAIQDKYTKLGQHINSFYTTIQGESPLNLWEETLKKLDKNPWVIPYMINGRYKTLWDFVWEQGTASEILSKNTGEMLDRFQKSFLDTPLSYLQWFVASLAWFLDTATLNLVQTQTTANWIFDALKSDPQYTTLVTYAFGKTMMTMSYLQNRKTALREKLQAEWLSWVELDQKIKELFDTQKMYTFDDKGNVTGGFVDYLEKNNMLEVAENEIDTDLQEKINQSNEEKWEQLEKIDDLEENLNKKTLSDADVQEFSTELMSEMNFFVDEGIEYSMLPIVSGLLNPDTELKKQLYNNSPLKLYADQCAKDLKIIHDKGKNISKEDIKKLREMTEEFYELRENFYTSEWYIQEAKDENWTWYLDIWLRLAWAARTTKDSVLYSYRVLTDSTSSILEKGKAWMVATGLLYTWYRFRGMATLKPLQFGAWFTKWVLATGMDGLNIAKWGASKIGRQVKWNLPNFLAASYYTTKNKAVLLKDVLNGRISGQKAVEVANKIDWLWKTQHIWNVEWLFKHYFANSGLTDDEIKFLASKLEDIQSNKNLRRQLFKPSGWLGKWRDVIKPSAWFDSDMSTLVPNRENIQRFQSLQSSISKLSWNQQVLVQSLLKATYSFDESGDIVQLLSKPQQAWFQAQQSLASLADDLVTKWKITAEELWNMLGKHSNILKQEGELRKFLWLLEQWISSWTIKNSQVFAYNILKNREKYKNKDIQTILWMTDDVEKLNQPKAITKALASLKDLKNKLLPYRFRSAQVNTTITELSETAALLQNPQAVSAMNSGVESALGNVTSWLSVEWKESLKILAKTIETDKKFAQALSKASSATEVKELLATQGITNLSDDVVEVMAKTSNGRLITGNRILDKINYLAYSDELWKFQKFLQNPSTKIVGRVLWKILAVWGVGAWLYQRIHSHTEASQVEWDNTHLAQEIRDEWLAYGLGVGVWWTLIGSWLALSRTPSWWVLLALGAATVAVDIGVSNFYASEKARAYNKSQFLKLWQGITDNFILENIFHPSNTKKLLPDQLKMADRDAINSKLISQTSDWIDAKILLSIYKLHPYATISGEVGEDDDTIEQLAQSLHTTNAEVRSLILKEKDIVSKLYDKAQEYIKQRSGTIAWVSNWGKWQDWTTKEYSIIKNLVQWEKDPIKVMQTITTEVWRSILYAQYHNKQLSNSNFQSADNLQNLITQKESIVWWNKKLFDTMENLYTHHPYQFLVIAQRIPKEESTDMVRLQNYIQRKQASTGLWLDMMMVNYWFDTQEIKQMEFDVNQFLKDANAFQTTVFTEADFKSSEQESRQWVCLDDNEITARYHISKNPIDTIMYRFATEVLWKGNIQLTTDPIQNEKTFEEHFPRTNSSQNGIYREGGQRYYNYDRARNPFDRDGSIHSVESLIEDLGHYYKQMFNSDKSGVDEHYVDTYKWEALKKIAHEELWYRKHKTEIIKETEKFITSQNLKQWEYIALPVPLLIKLTRAWVQHAGAYVYSQDNGKVTKMDKLGKTSPGSFTL